MILLICAYFDLFLAIFFWLGEKNFHPFTVVSQIVIFNVVASVEAAFALFLARHFCLDLLDRKIKILAQRINQFFELFIALIVTQWDFICFFMNFVHQFATELLFI